MDSVSDNAGREEAPPSPGVILAAERERQGLARADIAQRLHMSVAQIEALEIGDYERLPRGPFLRGFMRNYARALGLDAEAMVGLLIEDAPRETLPAIVVPTQNIRFDPLGQRLANPYVRAAGIAASVIVLGFAGMYWWLFIRQQGAAPAPSVKKPAVEAPKEEPVVPPNLEAPRSDASTVEQPVTPAAFATPPAGPATAASPARAAGPGPAATTAEPATAEPPRAAGPGEGTLRLAFRGAAWVEISDARGKVLVSRTHPGGSSAEVVGKPPFTLVIGNAPEVRLTYEGREVDLAPHTRVAVARFTLP